MADILHPLEKYRLHNAEVQIRAGLGTAAPARIRAGLFGTMTFMVTLDVNGQLDISLKSRPLRPTKGQITAFFRMLGQPIPMRVVAMRTGYHWISPARDRQ